jgi:DNA-3-methyladenine glycosylase II
MGQSALRYRYEVTPKRPYSLARTAARLQSFPEVVDRYENARYRRLLFLSGKPLLVEVEQVGSSSRARLKVRLTGTPARRLEAREEANRVMHRVLGTGTDVRAFYRRFRDDPLLGSMLQRHRGLRVAGRASVWETLLQIVLSQQIHLKLAHSMLADLAVTYGRRARFDGELLHSYPTPRRIAALHLSDLRRLRLSEAKTRTVLGLAKAFASGELSDEKLRAMDDEEAIELLTSFKGVGRWTAEFTLLRGMSRLDIFPASDLGVVKYLAQGLLGQESKAKEEDMRRFAERWRPYRGLALIYAYAELAGRRKSNRQ